MYYLLFMLAVPAAVESLVHVFRPQHSLLRAAAAGLALTALIVTTELMVTAEHGFMGMLLVFFAAYRLFNICRIIKGRMHQQYLWRVTYRTSLWLIGLQFAVLGAGAVWRYHQLPAGVMLGTGSALIITAGCIGLLSIRRLLRGEYVRTVLPANVELPSVTVAIPARNETTDLEACIASLLASDYPKLEILVLDDCSQMARTPEIIRSFAHDGVRFIQGTEPGSDGSSDMWLAKNWAYQRLLEAASGEYVLFCGVDVRVEPGSIRRLLIHMLTHDRIMASVMPQNVVRGWRPVLVQPMRYVWEIGMPRRLFGRPPVLSTAWVIQKRALMRYGGFAAATRMIVPEAYFARQAARENMYSFIADGRKIGIQSVKSAYEQGQTAIRVAYPQVHRRPEQAAVLTLGYVGWSLLPVAGLLYWHRYGGYPLLSVAVGSIGASLALYAVVLRAAYGRITFVSLLALPLAALWYAYLLNLSMTRYEFGTVVWKDRNVCVPVMHVVPHLPPLPPRTIES